MLGPAVIDATTDSRQARAMLRRFVALAYLGLAGACAAPPPLGCSSAVDGSGRGIPVCAQSGHVPVCDAPGGMAHFTGTATSSLTDGSLALCDASNQIVCSDRTMSPYCLSLPAP